MSTSVSQEGNRVFAIQKSSHVALYLIGYGTYLGEEEAPYGPLGMTQDTYRARHIAVNGDDIGFKPHKGAKIQLDNGDIIWGKECAWWPIEQLSQVLGDRVLFDVKDYQPRYAQKAQRAA